MRKYLFLFLILSICFNSISQGETEPYEHKKWMVKSILFSQPYVYRSDNMLPNFFTGIGAKRYFGEIGARFSFERMVNKSKSTLHIFDTIRTQVGGFEENVFRLGTEYKKSYYDFLSLHFFVDYVFIIFEGETTTHTNFGDIEKHQKLRGYSNGGIIGMGFDYLISEHFSIGLETRVELLYNTGNYYLNNFKENYSVNSYSSNNEFNLKLLGNFSLNYNF